MVAASSDTPSAVVLLEAPNDRKTVLELLEEQQFSVSLARDVEHARALLAETSPQLFLLRFDVACGDALELIRSLDGTDVQLVFLQEDIPEKPESFRHHVCGFLGKPFELASFEKLVADLSEDETGAGEASCRRDEKGGLDLLVGTSDVMRELYERIKKVSPTDLTVFLVGESGTGKELVAKTIHRLSKRRDGPIVAVNCGAVSPTLVESLLFGHEKGSFTGASRRQIGYFEQANSGTLFLDEITEMSLDDQVKLLRVLETSSIQRIGATELIDVDVRVVAASNRDPEETIAKGQLREDLFFRLQEFPIVVPPLRERDDKDLRLLAESFVEELNESSENTKVLTDAAVAELNEHAWPGNVRELKNVIRRAFVLSNDARIDAGDIETHPFKSAKELRQVDGGRRSDEEIRIKVGTPIESAEKDLILATLDQYGGDKEAAAKSLGISVRTLYYRLEKYGAEE